MLALLTSSTDPGVELKEAPVPEPLPNQAVVAVKAISLNRGEVRALDGKAPGNLHGWDFAGTVERPAADGTGPQHGARVVGFATTAWAQRVAVPTRDLAVLPAEVSFEQAAATPVSGMTALQGLRDKGHVEKGQRVLVFGAGGGIGHMIVQLARGYGATVTGVARPAKLDFVRSLGADTDVAGPYDLIMDTAGNRPIREMRPLLTRTGTLVIVGGEGGKGRFLGGFERSLSTYAIGPFVPQHVQSLISLPKLADLEALAGFLADGTLRPVIDRTFGLPEAPDAIRYLNSGEPRGKVVIAVASA